MKIVKKKQPVWKVFICIVLHSFLVGCGNTSTKSDVEVEDFNDSVSVIECRTSKEIPYGFSLGQVLECKGHNKEEENMLSQFRSYNIALLRGDIDNAMHYQYPDAAKYFKKYYPDESNDGVMRKLFEDLSMQTIEQIKRFESHGVEINIVVSRLVRKVTQGENIFYVFEIVSNMVNENLQIYTTPDLTLAVSSNNGKNWTFNAMNEDTPNILRISYSDEIVDKVMGY